MAAEFDRCTASCVPPGMLDHLRERPDMYIGCMTLAVLAAVSILGMQGLYLHRLFAYFSAFPSAVVRYTLSVALAPMVFAISKILVVVAPRWWAWADFIAAGYESAVLVAMLRLVTVYLGGPGEDLEVLASGQPNKVWAAQPLFCCWCPFYVCMAKRVFDSSDMLTVQALVWQRAAVGPTMAFVGALERQGGGASAGAAADRSRIEAISLGFAVYGLLVLVRAAERSHELHTGKLRKKFWALVAVLVGNVCLFHLLAMGAIPSRLPGEDLPLGCQLTQHGCYSPVDINAARASAGSATILVPLAYFLRQAFPAMEVANASQEAASSLARGHAVERRRSRGASQSRAKEPQSSQERRGEADEAVAGGVMEGIE